MWCFNEFMNTKKSIKLLLTGVLLIVSVSAYSEIYRKVSPSGHVIFTDITPLDYKKSIPKVQKTDPVIRESRITNKWISPNKIDRKITKPSELKALTDDFDKLILDNWLSSYWDCSNHLERIDYKHNNALYFFTKNSPLVIPIVKQEQKEFELFYSSKISYQFDPQKKVLMKYHSKGKNELFYICDARDVPQHYRERYATYMINQQFLSEHGVGKNIEIKDGGKFLEQACRQAYKAKEYETARSTCGLAAVNKNNIISKYYLGMLYRYFWGGEIDLDKSYKYMSEAANAGLSSAYAWLGWHYNFGKGVKKDYKEALRWYIAAVDAGDFESADSVANFYLKGKGIEVDYEQAAVWLLIAARAGDDHAQNKIGCMFANGVGVKQDYKSAHHWIRKSSQKNNPKAIFNLAVLYDESKIIKDGKGYAAELYKKAASYGLKQSSDIIDKLDRIWN